MPQEHERGLGVWQAEWETLPQAFQLSAAALEFATEIAEGMVVDAERMRTNFDALLGTSMAEVVSAALAPKIGRSAAHKLLRDAANCATRENRHLGSVLKNMPEVSEHLRADEIERLMAPEAYLGSAELFIDRVLGEADA
jgi:3-carboxy-cis,cis-muconate cycloisomerase